ncbi:hypothetical protein Tco_0659264 [Tanacetum coccineum]
MDEVIQPFIPQTIHTTPPNDDYVAPATNSILDELLEEFKDEIVNVTMVDEEADSNATRDIEELERLLAKDPHDDELLEKWMLLEKADVEHVVSSSYRANPGESFVLILL